MKLKLVLTVMGRLLAVYMSAKYAVGGGGGFFDGS
jgi:hypothetical protein